ncbi:GNAT family N-acetyltransferase [Henriciella sp.]|uniref:GNAT family N-acetyltransferase n=1 Tax=Henriciella sp. TaxID=1968823 RepID=UPI0026019EC0|nr:GNAT family N-acetyltransferase [Henriciella sp.]
MPRDSSYTSRHPKAAALSIRVGSGKHEEIDRLIAIDKAASTLFAPTGLLSAEALNDHVPASAFEHALDAGWLYVARLKTEIPIGFVMATTYGDDLYIEQISVDPIHGRRGAGRALMAHIEAEAKTKGVSALTLSTFRDLKWNAPFYRSLGYECLEPANIASYMLAIEEEQSQHMDVNARTFMKKRLRKTH